VDLVWLLVITVIFLVVIPTVSAQVQKLHQDMKNASLGFYLIPDLTYAISHLQLTPVQSNAIDARQKFRIIPLIFDSIMT
jgi:competence protein ComGC